MTASPAAAASLMVIALAADCSNSSALILELVGLREP